ncbi:MAG: ATP phosphoribosyltransferase regulatory subunit [Gammaproteobacteria bacterium]|nr:ATP phosphoribosyltransferase regulatory subunit [Gammaproteobacteria bacterium]
MRHHQLWMLPEGIEDLLPAEAALLEEKRALLLSLFQRWGYDFVIPPLVEYADSLLLGSGRDVDLKSYKLVDQLTGRTMALRADMTPQMLRIDASLCSDDQRRVNRLCYFGSLLQTLADEHGGSRSPIQAGAEIFGQRSFYSDYEIIRLLVASLRTLGIEAFYLDLGHVGIFRALAQAIALSSDQESELFAALQRKSRPDIDVLLEQWQLEPQAATMILALIDLHGDIAVLNRAEQLLAPAGEAVIKAIHFLRRLAETLNGIDGVTLHVDLAELRGYHYHSDVVFAAYLSRNSGAGRAIALGGRYDAMGRQFGLERPATGFSLDMRTLLHHFTPQRGVAAQARTVIAPCGDAPDLLVAIDRLRAAGERVIQQLVKGEEMGDSPHQLQQQHGEWLLVSREANSITTTEVR